MTPTIYGGPPGPDLFPDGVMIGGPCMGKVYVEGQAGYAFCDVSKWAYTSVDPASDGYTLLGDGGVGGDAGADADSSTVGDTGTDAGDGEAGPDAAFDSTGVTDSGRESGG